MAYPQKPAPSLPTGPQLADLAATANEEAARGDAATRHGLKHYRSAGEALLKAKVLCGHGKWLDWLKDNVRFSARSARAYMQLADGWDKLAAAANLSEALHLLADGGPEEEPPVASAAGVVETHAGDGEQGDGEEKAPADRAAAPRSSTSSHARNEDELPQAGAASRELHAEVGRLVLSLAEACSTVQIHTPDPSGREEVEASVTVCRRGADVRPQTYHRDGVVDCLRAAAAQEACRECPRCRRNLRPSDFHRDSSRPGGRFSWCRKCNRDNVAQHKSETAAACGQEMA